MAPYSPVASGIIRVDTTYMLELITSKEEDLIVHVAASENVNDDTHGSKQTQQASHSGSPREKFCPPPNLTSTNA